MSVVLDVSVGRAVGLWNNVASSSSNEIVGIDGIAESRLIFISLAEPCGFNLSFPFPAPCFWRCLDLLPAQAQVRDRLIGQEDQWSLKVGHFPCWP